MLTINRPGNYIVSAGLNLATAQAADKIFDIEVADLVLPLSFEVQVNWANVNVTTDTVKVYHKANKNSDIPAIVKDASNDGITFGAAAGNTFITIFPTGCNKFQVKIEGTANVGTVKIDLAVR